MPFHWTQITPDMDGDAIADAIDDDIDGDGVVNDEDVFQKMHRNKLIAMATVWG